MNVQDFKQKFPVPICGCGKNSFCDGFREKWMVANDFLGEKHRNRYPTWYISIKINFLEFSWKFSHTGKGRGQKRVFHPRNHVNFFLVLPKVPMSHIKQELHCWEIVRGSWKIWPEHFCKNKFQKSPKIFKSKFFFWVKNFFFKKSVRDLISDDFEQFCKKKFFEKKIFPIFLKKSPKISSNLFT